MDSPSKKQILLSSSGWVALILNFIPGIGVGYIYQRRWLAYFVTLGIALAWFTAGIIFSKGSEELNTIEQLIGIGGLILISITTMIEAKLAHNNVVLAVKKDLEQKHQRKRIGLFR